MTAVAWQRKSSYLDNLCISTHNSSSACLLPTSMHACSTNLAIYDAGVWNVTVLTWGASGCVPVQKGPAVSASKQQRYLMSVRSSSMAWLIPAYET
jgi:hypothetical protein